MWKTFLIGEKLSQMNSEHLPFPFSQGCLLRNCMPCIQRIMAQRASLESEGPSKTITTTKKTTGVRPYSASPFSQDGQLFPQEEKKNMSLGLFHNIFSLYNVLYLKNKKQFFIKFKKKKKQAFITEGMNLYPPGLLSLHFIFYGRK